MFLTALDFIVKGVICGRRKELPSKACNMQVCADPACNTSPGQSQRQSKSRQATIPCLKNTVTVLESNPRLNTVIVLILFCLVSSIFFRQQFFIALFVLAGATSRMLQKFIPIITAIDLCLFFSILVSVAYSPALGLVTGISASLIGSFLRQTERMEYYLTPLYGYVPIWIFMSLGIIPGLNILLTGMICVVLYVAARFTAILFTNKICIVSQMTYVSTALVFNYWLFSSFAPFLMNVML